MYRVYLHKFISFKHFYNWVTLTVLSLIPKAVSLCHRDVIMCTSLMLFLQLWECTNIRTFNNSFYFYSKLQFSHRKMCFVCYLKNVSGRKRGKTCKPLKSVCCKENPVNGIHAAGILLESVHVYNTFGFLLAFSNY